MRFKRLILALCLIIIFVATVSVPTAAITAMPCEGANDVSVNCLSAVLMEAETGCILYEHNADRALPPASVTKIMTLLLVMEAVEQGTIKLDEMLTCSANAASMGGSQVFLEEGEQMSVDDLIKCVVICSANDAAVVLAEAVAGSEASFVSRMNSRAAELRMNNTVFENTNGLDDTAVCHVTTARDIAIMSRELLRHQKILDYSSVWMDSIRGGAFGLTNTNRLIRFYPGATGLKTGSTAKAGFCISATAKREGMHLICVIMGAESRDIRNAEATKLLDWGFANYSLFVDDRANCGNLSVTGGVDSSVPIEAQRFCCIVPKGMADKVSHEIITKGELTAPVDRGDSGGCVRYLLDGNILGEADLIVTRNVRKITLGDVLLRIFFSFML